MEDFCVLDIEFSDKELNNLVDCLRQSFEKKQESFVLLCYAIYNIAEKFNKSPTYKCKKGAIYNKVLFFKLFGFEENQVSRYYNSYVKYCEQTSDVGSNLRSVFFGYSPSKLFELLPISNEQLEKDIASGRLNVSMTVKDIRHYVKSLKGETKSNPVYEDNNENEEEIPNAFDPTKYYAISYFESQSKQELINICKSYQNKYVVKGGK